MTVVAEELWMIAVVRAPTPTPAKRLLVIFPSTFFILLPAAFSRLTPMIFIPYINTARPPSTKKIFS